MYTGLFAISAASLLFLVYYLVAQELAGKEEEVIRSRAKEYASLFQTSGYAEFKRRVLAENDPSDEKAFFVSVVSLSMSWTPWSFRKTSERSASRAG